MIKCGTSCLKGQKIKRREQKKRNALLQRLPFFCFPWTNIKEHLRCCLRYHSVSSRSGPTMLHWLLDYLLQPVHSTIFLPFRKDGMPSTETSFPIRMLPWSCLDLVWRQVSLPMLCSCFDFLFAGPRWARSVEASWGSWTYVSCFLLDSFYQKGWRWATRLSTGGWVLKTGIGMANLIVFGACTRNGPGYEYAQGQFYLALVLTYYLLISYLSPIPLSGFWCAVLSVIISGIICESSFLQKKKIE